MAKCPLCSERPGKRYCPAKGVHICALCCGTKREVEIDCPSSCGYLKASRDYEAEKRIPDPEIAAKVRRFDDDFVHRYSPALDIVAQAVVEERSASPWLVDNDVIEVYKALNATMKTLASGIYYESLPDGPVRVSLFRRVRAVLDELMQPDPRGARDVLKVSEIVDVLNFSTFAGEMSSSVRPKSRRYLDFLSGRLGRTEAAGSGGGLIIP
jgi:hypothetical protein